jgi:redox-sensitive bicupin YhaK (pirin superfamily)
VLSGSVYITGHKEIVGDNYFVLFKNEGETFELTANDDAQVLVLSGAPIHEPIVAQGPFVMNTQAEITEAIRDYQTGGFGNLED